MNGPQHWAEADLILTGDADPCSYGCPHNGCAHEMAMLARAQVHATLALVCAIRGDAPPEPGESRAGTWSGLDAEVKP